MRITSSAWHLLCILRRTLDGHRIFAELTVVGPGNLNSLSNSHTNMSLRIQRQMYFGFMLPPERASRRPTRTSRDKSTFQTWRIRIFFDSSASDWRAMSCSRGFSFWIMLMTCPSSSIIWLSQVAPTSHIQSGLSGNICHERRKALFLSLPEMLAWVHVW